jgi:hypothetical protein
VVYKEEDNTQEEARKPGFLAQSQPGRDSSWKLGIVNSIQNLVYPKDKGLGIYTLMEQALEGAFCVDRQRAPSG